MISTQARVAGYLNLFILLLILFIVWNPSILIALIGGAAVGIFIVGLIVWGLVNFIRSRGIQEKSEWDSALLIFPVINFIVVIALIGIAIGME